MSIREKKIHHYRTSCRNSDHRNPCGHAAACAQFGNYGGEFLCRIAFWGSVWHGTEFALKPEQLETISHLAFDGFARVLHHGRMDLLAIGRQLRENAALIRGRDYCIRNFRIFAKLDPARADEYRRAEEEKFSGARWFWNSDYLTCRRDRFFASFRANSVRTRPLEDNINGDNSLGRYFSDGACLIYRTGDEYDGVTLCWDWTRLPGTTLPATPVLDEKPVRNGKSEFRADSRRSLHSVSPHAGLEQRSSSAESPTETSRQLSARRTSTA